MVFFFLFTFILRCCWWKLSCVCISSTIQCNEMHSQELIHKKPADFHTRLCLSFSSMFIFLPALDRPLPLAIVTAFAPRWTHYGHLCCATTALYLVLIFVEVSCRLPLHKIQRKWHHCLTWRHLAYPLQVEWVAVSNPFTPFMGSEFCCRLSPRQQSWELSWQSSWG